MAWFSLLFKEFSLYIKIVLVLVIKNEGSNFLQLYYEHFFGTPVNYSI